MDEKSFEREIFFPFWSSQQHEFFWGKEGINSLEVRISSISVAKKNVGFTSFFPRFAGSDVLIIYMYSDVCLTLHTLFRTRRFTGST